MCRPQLIAAGNWQPVSVSDLAIAATAERHGAIVLAALAEEAEPARAGDTPLHSGLDFPLLTAAVDPPGGVVLTPADQG